MIFDGNSAVLLIGTTYEEDSGIFTVRVTSSTGQVESSAKLTVKSKDWINKKFTNKKQANVKQIIQWTKMQNVDGHRLKRKPKGILS